jgi:hypothetical protein
VGGKRTEQAAVAACINVQVGGDNPAGVVARVDVAGQQRRGGNQSTNC